MYQLQPRQSPRPQHVDGEAVLPIAEDGDFDNIKNAFRSVGGLTASSAEEHR